MSRVDDLGAFREWALGDLTGNRSRGLFAEWLVSMALGGPHASTDPRVEWDLTDIRYRNRRIEVKTSGIHQSWGPTKSVSFGIAPVKKPWDASTNRTITLRSAQRVAALYVFCLDESVPLPGQDRITSHQVADTSNWRFWVVPTADLDKQLRDAKRLSVAKLDRKWNFLDYSGLKDAVDELIDEGAADPDLVEEE